jgi:predicted ATPase/DNA-binding XRE family transcriptional regulator
MDADMQFGPWLKRRRKALDLTQEDLARRVGYSVSAIRKVEADKLRPSRHVAEQMADVLEVTPTERPAFLRLARGEPAVDELLCRSAPLGQPMAHHQHYYRIPLTSFIGRERELMAVRELLSNNRLLTLTGVGGVGKTRLAIQLASDVANAFSDGVAWVELAALSDPVLAPQVIANALGLRQSSDQSLLETLAAYLLSQQVLLVLDNCEHLVTVCAQIAEMLLHSCPNLHILVTSREALGLTGEVIWPVPPLSVPTVDCWPAPVIPDESADVYAEDSRIWPPTYDWPSHTCMFGQAPVGEHIGWPTSAGEKSFDLTRYAAVRLFVERATAAQPEFSLTETNAWTVARICQRLDGLPLAIELAAACTRVLSIEQIAARLDDRFTLLTRGSRTALPRYRTLRATIDWSYDLLSAQEQALLLRLSVFAGGFTLEAATTVCGGEGIENDQIFYLLAHLVDKSLVTVAQQSEETRYGLLESIRQYAHDKARMVEEAVCLRRHHAHFFLAFAEKAACELNTVQRNKWMHRLQDDHENLRAAVRWAIEQEEAEVGFRMIGAMEDFWVARGYLTEAREHLEELLTLPNCGLRTGEWNLVSNLDSSPTGNSEAEIPRALAAARARALNAGARWAMYQDDLDEALALAEESVAHWRLLDHIPGLIWALSRLGEVKECLGDDRTARVCWEASLALARSTDHRMVVGWCLLRLGRLTLRQGDAAVARALMEESLVLWRALDNPIGICSTFRALGNLAFAEEDYASARAFLEESLHIARGCESTIGIIRTLLPLGHVALYQGDDVAACTFYNETLARGRASNQKGMIGVALSGLGIVAFKQGESARARSLLCESLSILQRARNKREIAQWLDCLAHVARTQVQPGNAARLSGVLAVLRGALCPYSALIEHVDNDLVASTRAALGEEAFRSAFNDGQAILLEQAVK